MKHLSILLFALLVNLLSFAQPANDDCAGLIDLGEAPVCPPDIYDNIDATASDIGFGNIPACFNGGAVQNDVFFAFTCPVDITNFTIAVNAASDGPNQAILNPQIAVYRGECLFNGLAEVGCVSSPDGSASTHIDLLGLTPGSQYFLRINDYSASASPNWGDFRICITEYVPAINIGDVVSSTSCFGTLYDSGGPDEDYTNNEDHTFTVCPTDLNNCIEIDLIDFNLETNFDHLYIYAGDDINAPLITDITGGSNGQPFPIQSSSGCVTFQFTSDGSGIQPGFELNWQCTPADCTGIGFDNPHVINSIPFSDSGVSTCDAAATFADSPCGNTPFLNGPEYVFEYTSPGAICASIEVTGGLGGTGVLVLNGPLDDPATLCVAQAGDGSITSANFQDPGTYYIVVANGDGCTDFDISIQESDCSLSPALVDALCNPLNGCIEPGGIPSIFLFEDGFEDMTIDDAVNGGCWLGNGAEPDFYWFTIEAQADGPFGFVLESADNPSDIDFNVWGPFSQTSVCDSQAVVIDYIANNQPLRSSWAAGPEPTGLADIHPQLGTPVEDEWDCGDTPGAGGDDFVSTIPAMQGEVFVVLVNDFGNVIADAGISVDWGPSFPPVLDPIPVEILNSDTAICAGEPVQLNLQSGIESIQWISDTTTLSCLTCFDPIASPSETTIYKAVIDAVCYSDTIEVKVAVFDVDAGLDVSVCSGEEIQIVAGSDYDYATYEWNAPPEVELSCLDCPDPFVSSSTAGDYQLSVTLNGPSCTVDDVMTLTVLSQTAPEIVLNGDQQICEGESVTIGGTATPGVNYEWTSDPGTFYSDSSDPEVSPLETTTYYVSATNMECPLPSIDSVQVEVFINPILQIANDTTICQGDSILLGNTIVEEGVTYLWDGPGNIVDENDPNSMAAPQMSGTYSLAAVRGECITAISFEIEVSLISVEVLENDTLTLCRGDEIDIEANASPPGVEIVWTPEDGSLNTNTGPSVTAKPETITSYFAIVSVPGCERMDSITIVVDSLPSNLGILPADTTICEGEQVILVSQIYEPADFPNIDFQWSPGMGMQTPDSLYNLVVSPNETVSYMRISQSGICADTAIAVVNVVPQSTIEVVPADTSIGNGSSVQFEIVGEFADQLDDISWTPEEGLSCSDCPSPLATPTATSGYSVTANFMDCPLASGAFIQVVDLPPFALIGDTEICIGDSIQLNLNFDPEMEYFWTSTTDPDFLSYDPAGVFAPEENTTYVLTVANLECGEVIVGEVTISVVPEVSLTMPEDFSILADKEFEIQALLSPEVRDFNEIFEWFKDGSPFAQGTDLIMDQLAADSSTYILEYTYGPDCGTLIASITASVPTYSIPNAFTPNNDTVNDIFRVKDYDDVKLFQVFSRWGQLVFESTTNEGWDGRYEGKPSPSDVYVYYIILDVDGTEEVLKGDVTLIR